MFSVEQPTPPEGRIKSVKVDESVARKLLMGAPEIEWPSVGDGLTKGRCAVYIAVDRTGKVREVWPEGCDNAGLEDPHAIKCAEGQAGCEERHAGADRITGHFEFQIASSHQRQSRYYRY